MSHPITHRIFKDHEAWLKQGGDMALEVVRLANLVTTVDRYLVQAEATARAREHAELKAAADALEPDLWGRLVTKRNHLREMTLEAQRAVKSDAGPPGGDLPESS